MIKRISSRQDRAIHIRRIGQCDFCQEFAIRWICDRPRSSALTAGPFAIDKQLLGPGNHQSSPVSDFRFFSLRNQHNASIRLNSFPACCRGPMCNSPVIRKFSPQ
jgi:hypothetical protein